MARIGVTGAAGQVGRTVLPAFADHDVVAFTHSEREDMDSETLDVTDAEAVTEKLDTLDAVVHLAGASDPAAEWDTAVELNVGGTKAVLDAAVDNGIDRVVFGSSNHAVGMYNAAETDDPESMTVGRTRAVRGDAPTRPDSFYGVSKVACEGLTSYYAELEDLEVVNLRIGWLMDESDLRENTGDGVEPGTDRFARATYLSPRDCRDVHLKAATADLPESPLTLNAVSRNDERFHTITETMQAIGYEPRDNAAEVLDE